MIFISDYSLRSKDILLLTTFHIVSPGGLTYMCTPSPTIKNKKKFSKKNSKNFKKK